MGTQLEIYPKRTNISTNTTTTMSSHRISQTTEIQRPLPRPLSCPHPRSSILPIPSLSALLYPLHHFSRPSIPHQHSENGHRAMAISIISRSDIRPMDLVPLSLMNLETYVTFPLFSPTNIYVSVIFIHSCLHFIYTDLHKAWFGPRYYHGIAGYRQTAATPPIRSYCRCCQLSAFQSTIPRAEIDDGHGRR